MVSVNGRDGVADLLTFEDGVGRMRAIAMARCGFAVLEFRDGFRRALPHIYAYCSEKGAVVLTPCTRMTSKRAVRDRGPAPRSAPRRSTSGTSSRSTQDGVAGVDRRVRPVRRGRSSG